MRISDKYKPCKIVDFCMSEQTKNAIALMVTNDVIDVLLIGNPASGKTTLIDAIVHEYYSMEPGSGSVRNNTNVLHLNTILNLGVSSAIAQAKSFCQAKCCLENRKKIVVIDDLDLIIDTTQQIVHWLVDQFGDKVHFIASCTNLRSVSNHAQSSFLHIEIPVRTKQEMQTIFRTIIHGENAIVSEDAEQFIMDISQTDINALTHYAEKLTFVGLPITLDIVRTTCTTICFSVFNRYFDTITQQDIGGAIKQMSDIVNQGNSGIDILDALLMYVKCSGWFASCDAISDPELAKYSILSIIGKYIACSRNMNTDELELAFFTGEICAELAHL